MASWVCMWFEDDCAAADETSSSLADDTPAAPCMAFETNSASNKAAAEAVKTGIVAFRMGVSGARALEGRSPAGNAAFVRPQRVRPAPAPRSFVECGNKFIPPKAES